MTILRKNDYVP
jgi:hypothetical protein